jgi:glutamyl-tRNA synthetase
VRTALFNWLWARKNGGSFVLRIEDTDQERSTPESKAIILESLKWLGMDWDEGPEVGGPNGPYEQMARLDIYRYYADKLIAEGKAYRCYCTEEELRASREELKARRAEGDKTAFFKYPGTCRDRKDHPDRPFVVRFKAPTDGVVEYNDLVFGKMVVPNKENQDFVLMRNDGVPLYNFGAVIDDLTMGMTLVARGRDHMINTPPQILIYQALGAQHPQFAHLPMMLSPTGEKLSKRHGAVSTTEYRDAGFSPQAVLNYLAKFGWGFGNQEVFSVKDLIDKFSWEGCGRNDGRFDVKKFLAIEHEHLQREDLMSTSEYAHRVIPFLYERGLGDLNHQRVEEIIHLIRHKCKTFVEAAHELDPILRKDISVDTDAAQKFLTGPNKEVLQKLSRFLADSIDGSAWKEEALRVSVKDWLANNGLTLKDIGQPIRVATIGRTTGPELFQAMGALGKDVTIERLSRD